MTTKQEIGYHEWKRRVYGWLFHYTSLDWTHWEKWKMKNAYDHGMEPQVAANAIRMAPHNVFELHIP